MDSNTRRKATATSRKPQQPTEALFLLIIILTGAVVLEVLLVDVLFLGQNGIHDARGAGLTVAVSAADMYISDSGALVESADLLSEGGGGRGGDSGGSGTTKEGNKGESSSSKQTLQTKFLKGGLRPAGSILEKAGVEITPELSRQLPPMEEVDDLYGDRPIVMGLESCKMFRDTIPSAEAFIAPAGMFNSGTHLVSEFLQRNCYMPDRVAKYGRSSRGIRLQVPWGKHTPMSWRGHNVAKQAGGGVNQTNVLPIVVIKDPYTWMTSMCRHPYSVGWYRKTRCPSLVPNSTEETKNSNEGSFPVTVKYSKTEKTTHKSLVGLWNDYYTPWLDAPFPRLIVRFEDLLYHPEELVREICHCGGGVMEDSFKYVADSAKGGGSHTGGGGLTSSMIRYSNATTRIEPFTGDDLRYAVDKLRVDIIDAFHYRLRLDNVQ